jgi:hypothetical protein
LTALTQNEENLLFGRADVIGEIVDNCRAERLTALTSEPGLGVTSLLQAGVAPALRREGFAVAIFSEWQGRFFATNLREAVANAVREATDTEFYAESEQLDELLDRVARRTGLRVAILLDQFEDYIRCHSNSEISDAFDAELAHAVSTRRAAFVLGLQAHSIPAFDRLTQHIPNLRGFEIQLKPIDAEAARKAVLAEASGAYLEVEPAAVEAIVTAPIVTTESGGVHPFFLKVATSAIINAAIRQKALTVKLAGIDLLGGTDRIVLDYLDAPISEFGTTQMDLLFRWCNILISPERHRLAVTEKGLSDYAGKLNRFVPPLLHRLAELGILRTVDAGGTTRYEIARDCYTPILRDWWERREAAIVARRRANFRIRSLSVAASAIVLIYVLWLIFSK